MAKCKITKIGLQSGTDRTVYVTWSWGKTSQTDKYDVRWYYSTGDGVRFIGSEQQVEITNAQCKDFLDLKYRSQSYHILKSLHLPYTGATKSRKYKLNRLLE